MKRILLQILLALCIVPSQAQDSPTGDLYYGVVKWGDRKLRWDDFRAKNPKNGKTSSYVGLVAKPKPKTKIVDGIKYKYTDWENFVIQKESWMDANNMNESKLKHCQNQFDLWEYLVRKVAVDYPRKQDVSLDMQYYEMQKTFDAEIDKMNKLTNHGNNAQVVDSIADELAKELSEKELDPRDIVKGYEPSKVYWMSDVGLVMNVPFTGYASPAVGFSGGVSYNRNRFLFGLDFDMTFGKCTKQILAKKGHIEDGDWLSHGGFTHYFGYNVYNWNKKSFTPFIGAGVRFFYGGEKYEEYRKRQAYTCSKEYMMAEKGLSEDEWKSYNKMRASTLPNFISRYGEELGRRKWFKYCAHEAYAGCSLTYFQDKYGDEIGKLKYDELCRKKGMIFYSGVS